jgi:hypothetical protein
MYLARDFCLSSQPVFFANKLKNRINHGFALTYNMQKNNANEFEIYAFQRFQT